MQWLYLIIALIVGFGLGHFVCWLGREDTATDAALAADKPVDGERAKPKVWVDKKQHEELVALWKALRLDSFFSPLETLHCVQADRSQHTQDAERLLRQRDYYQGKRPPHLAYKERRSDELQRLRDQIDKWPEGAMSPTTTERNAYRRMLRCYVGEPEKGGMNPLGETTQRHMFIQEQASQCGYSTILYSLSPSSSIFTPNYVNGFQQFAQQPAPSCAATSTSKGCLVLSDPLLIGLRATASPVQPRTRCPSCHRSMSTAYKQKCIPCRRDLRPIP
jgi:hypothetical protein